MRRNSAGDFVFPPGTTEAAFIPFANATDPNLSLEDLKAITRTAAAWWELEHAGAAVDANLGPVFARAAYLWWFAMGHAMGQDAVLGLPWGDVPWDLVSWSWFADFAASGGEGPSAGARAGFWDIVATKIQRPNPAPAHAPAIAYEQQFVTDPAYPGTNVISNTTIPGTSTRWADVPWGTVPWADVPWKAIPWGQKTTGGAPFDMSVVPVASATADQIALTVDSVLGMNAPAPGGGGGGGDSYDPLALAKGYAAAGLEAATTLAAAATAAYSKAPKDALKGAALQAASTAYQAAEAWSKDPGNAGKMSTFVAAYKAAQAAATKAGVAPKAGSPSLDTPALCTGRGGTWDVKTAACVEKSGGNGILIATGVGVAAFLLWLATRKK